MALTTDTLFVGPTRPTMVWGVTYHALVANAMLSGITFIGTHNVLYLAVCIPIHAISYLVCANDPRAFELIGAWLKTKGKNLNRRFWGSSSYSPLEHFREPVDPKAKAQAKGKKRS